MTVAAGVLSAGTAPNAGAQPEATSDPNSLIAALIHGNSRFVSGGPAARDDGGRRARTAGAQTPFAAVVGCADARVAPEFIFDRAIGELYVVRSSGGVAGTSERAALEHAVNGLGVPLLVVLGHEGCDAVAAAVESSSRRRAAVAPGLDAAVRAIAPAVRATPRDGRDTAAYIDACATEHVRATIRSLLSGSRLLADAVRSGRLTVIGARYGLVSGRVTLIVDPAASRALLPPARRARR